MIQMTNAFATPTQDAFVQVINQSGFNFALMVEYVVGTSNSNFFSGVLGNNDIARTKIPTNATKISVIVYSISSTNISKVVYLKNFTAATTLKLLVTGLITAPVCTDITNPATPHIPINSYILVNNQGVYTARAIVKFTIGTAVLTPPSKDILTKSIGMIEIPSAATNIQLTIQASDKIIPFTTIYSNILTKPTILKISLSGTVSKPIVTDLAPLASNVPVIQLNKTPNKTLYNVGETVTFTITIANTEGGNISNAVLTDNIPNEATFLTNSLTLDDVSVDGANFLNNGLALGNMAIRDSFTVTYKMLINSMPNPNPVENEPVINYDYVDTNGANQIGIVTGIATPFTVTQNGSGNCCCCCPCMCNYPNAPTQNFF